VFGLETTAALSFRLVVDVKAGRLFSSFLVEKKYALKRWVYADLRSGFIVLMGNFTYCKKKSGLDYMWFQIWD